ncbi:hypothetical protein llg_41110 [Luteolibacter sp. LG18]|nr:hypothetical protein llg_41110 [Luteolibacter sp. LG18]
MYRTLVALAFSVLPLWAAEFSVYLTPPEMNANGRGLSAVSDLNIDVDGVAIPVELVEGRQSITYPCKAGAEVAFFRVTNDDKKTRVPVVSTQIPTGVEKGLLVLAPSAGGYKVTPFWFSSSDLRNGSGIFVNLTSRELGIVAGEKKIQLAPGKRWSLEGRFTGNEMLVPTHVQIYARKPEAESGLVRILDRQVGVPKDDTGIYMILPKQEDYVTLLTLECSGLRDVQAKEALGKKLNPKGDQANQGAPVTGMNAAL